MRLRRPNALSTPVRTSRQWTTALAPNGDGWNYVACSWPGGATAIEWAVVRNLTTDPTTAISETPSRHYPNSNYKIVNQLRAQNGRIFFPCFDLYTAYYDPTTEQVHEIGPVVEDPPVDPATSTIFFSGAFDTSGLLYLATQESKYRPCCVVVTDTDTLAQTVLGYVGDGALSYTTYGYYIAPDTGTAAKYVYIAFGQNPWQLWALNITPGASYGTATKLYEVTNEGNISFQDISGEGWIATIHTKLNQPDNVTTRWWCLDGALYAYTNSQPPPAGAPAPRNVTSGGSAIVSPPQLDVSRGIGQVLWRPNGSTGDYTLVEYDVNYRDNIAVESLLVLSDGSVLGNAASYQGFFRYRPSGNVTSWYGNWTDGLSQPVLVEVDGLVYMTGYPNSALYRYDPAQTWLAGTNPVSLGTFNSTAHTHYPYCLEHHNGRLYMLGRRERTGVGGGLAYYDIAAATYTGTATDLTFGNPSGLIVLPEISRIVASLAPLDGSDGVLVVFDYDLVEVARWTLDGISDPGKLYACRDGQSVTGVSTADDVAYRLNVVSGTLHQQVSLGGAVSASLQQTRGGEILVKVDTAMKSLDPNTLHATAAFSGYSGMSKITAGGVVYFSDGATLYQQSKISDGSARRRQRRRRGPWWF